MARRRPGLVAVRRIVAGGFLFVGLFVLCFGLGNGRQPVMVAGVAIVVLAFIGRLAAGLRRNPREWILGTGHVVDVSEPPPDTRYGRCTLHVVVDAPGMPPETVLVDEPRVQVDSWPRPGQELPIQVAADDVQQVRVVWRDRSGAGVVTSSDQDEGIGEVFWADDQPTPVPAEPPGSHLDPPETAVIDFDLDAPPDDPLRPVPTPAAESTEDEGQVDHDAPPVPRPRTRPSPRPRRIRLTRAARAATAASAAAAPAAAAASTAATAAAAAPAATGTAAATLDPGDVGDPVDPVIDELVTTYPSAHPGPAGAINGVGVTLLVSDLDRSVAFYRDRLGFYEVDGGEGNVVLASGETRLVLRQASDFGTVKRRLVHLNLEVADIDAMYDELKANGIRFSYPPKPVNRSARLELWAAPFQDPDGHGIAITQWRSAAG